MKRSRLIAFAISTALVVSALLPASASALQTGRPGKTTTAACTEGSTMRVETILGTFVYKCQNGMWICIALETSASFAIAKSG